MSVVGTRVGRILVESELGQGGMGEVYVGYDETLKRRVALKSIRASHRLSSQAKARFVREAQVLSRLDHPNVCKIHDLIEGEDRDYLVLELIRGRNLAAAIDEGLSPAKCLEIARAIADALVAAHTEGVVHRDLKPENVMLTESGEIKVLDFGLARLGRDSSLADAADPTPAPSASLEALPRAADTPPGETLATEVQPANETFATELASTAAQAVQATPQPEVRTSLGTVMGTLTYMSPEQARGEFAASASDMYSFGLVLQTLFTGRGPYPPEADREEIYRRALAADTLPVTGIDGDLAKLIASLKSLAPAARPTAVATAERLAWIADRPKRRMRWLAAAAVLAVLALGGIKYTLDLRRERTIAVAAREVADQRRGQAEDLIAFMLGDLRKKLEPVGRLEILDDVGKQAMEYFASVPEDELSDDELSQRSKALYQLGEVRIAQGDLPAAEAALEQSLSLAKALSARAPNDGDRLFGVGQSHFWAGYVHWLQGDLESTLAEYQRYLDISERLIEIDPDNLDWQLEVGYAYTNIAAVHLKQGRLESALAAGRRSNSIKERLVASDPANLAWSRSLANGVSWVGSILWSANRLRDSLAAFERELEIRRGLVAKEPRNRDAAFLLSITEEHLGKACLALGDTACARNHYRQAVARLDALVALDESNSDWKRELAVARVFLGDTLFESGSIRVARDQYEVGWSILERLVESDPTNSDWQRHLARAQLGLARVALGSNPERALSMANRALAVLGPLRDDADEWFRQTSAEAHLLQGLASVRVGRSTQAEGAWARALELLSIDSAADRSLLTLDLRSQALLFLERTDEARPLVDTLTSNDYARPAFIALCRERGLVAA